MIPKRVRKAAVARADWRCEYCRTPLRFFQVDHIVSRRLGGTDDLDNLACACVRCNLAKGPLISGLDENGAEIRLFNPRIQRWDDHFNLNGVLIEGLTSIGRITVDSQDERPRQAGGKKGLSPMLLNLLFEVLDVALAPAAHEVQNRFQSFGRCQ